MRKILLAVLAVVLLLGAVPAGFGLAYLIDISRPDDLRGVLNFEAGPSEAVLAPRSASIPLAEAFPELEAGKDRVFRASKLILAPGQATPVLHHDNRPGITFVAYGTVTEQREGAEPRRLKAGDHTLDKKDVVHSWVNRSPAPVVLVIGEIVPATEVGP